MTKEAHQKTKTTDHVYWLITANVKDGELKNLKQINAEMVKNTEDNEPDTLTYDWSISDDGKKCYFFEHYANSKAVMVHKDFGEKLANRLLGRLKSKVSGIWQPDDEVRIPRVQSSTVPLVDSVADIFTRLESAFRERSTNDAAAEQTIDGFRTHIPF